MKFQLLDLDGDDKKKLASGMVERIGIDGGFMECESLAGQKKRIDNNVENHTDAVGLVLATLCDVDLGIIASLEKIDAVGHRVVHGGEEFSKSILIDDEVMAAIDKYSDLAPLHNPANKAGIIACQKLMPGTPQVAVFDTAFHESMPASSYLYAIPYEYYSQYGIRRYGFHGTSHKYVFYETAKFLNKDATSLKAIICHLGNGASMTAVDGGRVIDTSMGFTPLDGLVMGTRSGELDASILVYIAEKENLSLSQVNDILNKKSGLLGLSGTSSDMRDILKASLTGDERAQIALDVYIYRITKFIGAYTAALNGVDAIVFTAGVGERSDAVRKMVVDKLSWLGVELDNEKNKNISGKAGIISTDDSMVQVLVVPTDEEYMIAKDVYDICFSLNIG